MAYPGNALVSNFTSIINLITYVYFIRHVFPISNIILITSIDPVFTLIKTECNTTKLAYTQIAPDSEDGQQMRLVQL